MITVGGNGFKALAEWERVFQDGEKAVSLASRAMAEEMLDLTFERFRVETDPYGKRWKPKQRPDGRKTLSGKTSRLKRGWHIVRADHGGWIIAPSVDHALPHQAPLRGPGGRLKRPRRMMVPDAKRGLPRAYRAALQEAGTDALHIHFAGGGSLIPNTLTRRFNIRAIVRRVVKQSVAGNG